MRGDGTVVEQCGDNLALSSAPGDDELLHAVACGDRAAFAVLMGRHVRPMLLLATRVTRNPDEADEIVQEAFLKVWKMAGRWQPDREAKFSTWLYRVVLNASLDHRRRVPFAPIEDAGDPPDTRPGGLDHAVTRQRDRLIALAMAEVSDRQRAALSLHYFADLSAPDAARVMGLSVAAVESLLVRGKKALKKALERRGITEIGDVT